MIQYSTELKLKTPLFIHKSKYLINNLSFSKFMNQPTLANYGRYGMTNEN